MIKFLYKMNRKYDYIEEPKRFFVFFAMALPGIILSTANISTELSFAGMAWLLILLAIRALYMHKAFHPKTDDSEQKND